MKSKKEYITVDSDIKVRRAEGIKLYNRGWGYTAISKALAIPRTTVRRDTAKQGDKTLHKQGKDMQKEIIKAISATMKAKGVKAKGVTGRYVHYNGLYARYASESEGIKDEEYWERMGSP